MVKIVTDSSCDILNNHIEELGISIVPLKFTFGLESFKDGEISEEESYQKLEKNPKDVFTSAPSIGEYHEVYDRLLKSDDKILSIHLSGKLSGTYGNALTAAGEFGNRIRVVDSTFAAMALGFLVMEAAAVAKSGISLKDLEKMVLKKIKSIKLRAVLDTLDYAVQGGRLKGLLLDTVRQASKFLNVKVILSFKDGDLSLAGTVRPKDKIKKMVDFISRSPNIERVAVEYSFSNREEAEKLKAEIKSAFPGISVYLSKLSLAVGCHGGPGVLAVATQERTTE
jgi:DegV family protein with EDD domain